MQVVLLKTDVLFFVLLGLAAFYAFYASRREHLRAPWRQVAERPLGMAAAVVLSAYLVVAVLDSCHFHPRLADNGGERAYSSEIVSLLDVLVAPLRANVETTYSAPFAVRAYAKEVIIEADGSTRRDYPPLAHGGAHLADPSRAGRRPRRTGRRRGSRVRGSPGRRWSRCWSPCSRGARAGRGTPCWLRYSRGVPAYPWRVVLLTAALLLALVGACITVAPYYHVLGTDKTATECALPGAEERAYRSAHRAR